MISFLAIMSLSVHISLQQESQEHFVQYVGELREGTFRWLPRGGVLGLDTYEFGESVVFRESDGIIFTPGKRSFAESGNPLVTPGSVVYRFEFKQDIDLTAPNGRGTVGQPDYQSRLKIPLSGRTFQIIGVDQTRFTALGGRIGFMIKEPGKISSIVTTEDLKYYVRVLRASDQSWADFEVVNSITGEVVDPLVTVTGEGQVELSENSGVEIRALRINVFGTDPSDQTIAIEVAIGDDGETQTTYQAACDISSTGALESRFPGESDWCIRSGSGSFSQVGKISAGDVIEVVYQAPQFVLTDENVIALPSPEPPPGVIQDTNPHGKIRVVLKNIKLSPGYNMISSPVLEGVDVSDIYNSCDTSGITYWYNPEKNAYDTVSRLEPTKGYWLRSSEECTINVEGALQTPITSIPLKKGWNMFSGTDVLNETIGDCNGKIKNIAWHYDPDKGEYQALGRTSGDLRPNNGYWILASEDCILN